MMVFDLWIQAALKDLDADVVPKLSREFGAHFEELLQHYKNQGYDDANSNMLVLQTMGNAEEVNTKLKKIHLTYHEANILNYFENGITYKKLSRYSNLGIVILSSLLGFGFVWLIDNYSVSVSYDIPEKNLTYSFENRDSFIIKNYTLFIISFAILLIFNMPFMRFFINKFKALIISILGGISSMLILSISLKDSFAQRQDIWMIMFIAIVIIVLQIIKILPKIWRLAWSKA